MLMGIVGFYLIFIDFWWGCVVDVNGEGGLIVDLCF